MQILSFDQELHAADLVRSLLLDASNACSVQKCLRRSVKVESGQLFVGGSIFPLSDFDRVVCCGMGKVALSLIRELCTLLNPFISVEGIIVSSQRPTAAQIAEMKNFKFHIGSHPLPDSASVNRAQEILQIVHKTTRRDLLIFGIIGGASAMVAMPKPGISIAEKQRVTQILMKRGAPINELNAVRAALSQIKGGQLLSASNAHTNIALILSDEPHGGPWGPTVPLSDSQINVLDILEKYNILVEIPGLEKVASAFSPPQLAPQQVLNVVIGNATDLCNAAVQVATSHGLKTMVVTDRLEGDSSAAGKFLAALAKSSTMSGFPISPPCTIISAGETTVDIGQSVGLGGRNQEMALAFATSITGIRNIAFGSIGTDGKDGSSSAAGAVVNGETIDRGLSLGLDAQEFLATHNSHRFFEHLGDQIHILEPQTNLMDLQVAIVLS